MNNEDIDKSSKMATEEQKRVSQIQVFVKIVPKKKNRAVFEKRASSFFAIS